MKKKFIILWIIFFIILFLSPISGDDWDNYVVGRQGLLSIIYDIKMNYLFWEGRLVSRAFINLLTYNKWLWNIINSFLISIMIIYIVKIIKPDCKNKNTIFLLILLGILCMNIYMFSQTVTWVAGNITYLFPLVLFILYLYFIKTDQVKKCPVIFGILNFILPMFVEHMAVLLIILNIIVIIINYVKNKKIDKLMVIYLCISIFSTLFMFLSPGNRNRIRLYHQDFARLSIIGKIMSNLPSFIYYTFLVNEYLNILWLFVMIYLNHHTTKNNILRWIIDIFITLGPIYAIFNYNFKCHYSYYTPTYIDISWHIILYYLFFMILFLYFIIKNIKQKDYFYIFILVMLGLSSNVIMMISPTWGYRTSFTTMILLLIAIIWIISKIKLPNITSKILSLLTVVVVIIYFVLYINLYQINQERKQIIKEDISSNSEIIRVKILPSYAPNMSNPLSDFHKKAFKKFYQIDDKKAIILIYK